MSRCNFAYTMYHDQGFKIVIWMSLGYSLMCKMAIRVLLITMQEDGFQAITPTMGERELSHTSVPFIHHETKSLKQCAILGLLLLVVLIAQINLVQVIWDESCTNLEGLKVLH